MQRLFYFVTFTLMAGICCAQTLQDAQGLLNQQKYSEAAEAFKSLTIADANNGAAWFGLGQAEEQLKQSAGAVESYERSIKLNNAPRMAMLFIARTYAATGDTARAYEWLDRLVQSGPSGPLLASLNSAPQFSAMATDPRFKGVQEKMKPCNSPEYHQFDFWIGSWEVYNPQGQRVGHNDVRRTINECIIQENWASGRGVEHGTSFNYYDNRDKKWHQIYFDNSGNMGNYPPIAGDFTDGRMVLLSSADQNPLSRWTWYVISEGSAAAKEAPGTKVRQWAEQSTDGGKTWITTWDSVYVKQ